MKQKLKSKKSDEKLWVGLIIFPFAGLILVAIMQIIVRLVVSSNGSSQSGVVVVSNIVSALVGMVSAICLILLPVWIIMLLRIEKRQKNSR